MDEEKKTPKPAAVRLGPDLQARLERLKASEHPNLPQAPFLIQAVRFYLDAAEKCGIDSDTYEPLCEIHCKQQKRQENKANSRHSRPQ